MKRMIGLAKANGAYVLCHSDGTIRDILSDLVDIGIEILNPVRWRCPGMERENLKQDFGEKLVFHGGVNNQKTLPFGTTEDVRDEVIDNYEILGRNNGHILAPCHNIQAVTPPGSVVAMHEAGHECGWRG